METNEWEEKKEDRETDEKQRNGEKWVQAEKERQTGRKEGSVCLPFFVCLPLSLPAGGSFFYGAIRHSIMKCWLGKTLNTRTTNKLRSQQVAKTTMYFS